MPLVTAEDVERAAECMKKHKLSELVLGDGDTGAKLVRAEGGRTGYFLTSPHFVKVSDAKSFPLVYNELNKGCSAALRTQAFSSRTLRAPQSTTPRKCFRGLNLCPFAG